MLLTEDQQALVEVARRFAQERLRPEYQRRELQGNIDRALLREMGSMGLLGLELPKQYGGLAEGALTTGLVTEAIAYGDFNVSFIMLLCSLLCPILHRNAKADLAMYWNRRCVAGEALLALGLTEPRGGADAANLAMKARKSGDSYILSGEKTSITLADQCDAIIVFARTGSPGDGARGVSAFLVPIDLPGIERTRFQDLGGKILGRGSVFFDDVRVPADNLLGREGEGFTEVMKGFDYSRTIIALQCVAAAQASIDETWQYVKERRAMNTPIVQFQGVSFPLAEYETQLAACRQLSYHGLALKDAGLPHTVESAMVKWWGPKIAVDAIHQCLLTFGHYGWSHDLPHQQRLRDVMGLELGDGPAQIMKLIIARERGGRLAVQYR